LGQLRSAAHVALAMVSSMMQTTMSKREQRMQTSSLDEAIYAISIGLKMLRSTDDKRAAGA
jgi:hypothetical protein